MKTSPLVLSHLQSFRGTLSDKQVSDESFKLMAASWTEKSYSSAWKKILWCDQTSTELAPTTIGPVINFLSEEFGQGKQYTTVNTYRSALSATHLLLLMGNQ